MALCKKIELPSGYIAEYHRISILQTHFNTDPASRCVLVTVSCYRDAETREKDLACATTWSGKLLFTEVTSDEPSRKEIYTALKALPHWTDATDC